MLPQLHDLILLLFLVLPFQLLGQRVGFIFLVAIGVARAVLGFFITISIICVDTFQQHQLLIFRDEGRQESIEHATTNGRDRPNFLPMVRHVSQLVHALLDACPLLLLAHFVLISRLLVKYAFQVVPDRWEVIRFGDTDAL